MARAGASSASAAWESRYGAVPSSNRMVARTCPAKGDVLATKHVRLGVARPAVL